MKTSTAPGAEESTGTASSSNGPDALSDDLITLIKERHSAKRHLTSCVYSPPPSRAPSRNRLLPDRSWVSGTYIQALHELDYHTLSCFSPTYCTASISLVPTAANDIIASWAAERASSKEMSTLVPRRIRRRLGVGWIIAATVEWNSDAYEQVLKDEIAFLMSVGTRSDGAISHRRETVQLW
jgi:hypothetical protein